MQSSDAPNPSPTWTGDRLRRASVVIVVLATSVLYCLGLGSYYVKEHLVTSRAATSPSAITATSLPDYTTPVPDIVLPGTTLMPTPTQMTLIFPTAKPTATPTLTETPPTTATASGTPSVTTTVTVTGTPTLTTSPTGTETPTPSETPTAQATETTTATPTPSETATVAGNDAEPTPTVTPSTEGGFPRR